MTNKYFDPSQVKRYSIHDRKHLVSKDDFATTDFDSLQMKGFFDSLPNIYAAKQLREIALSINKARQNGRIIHAAMGAHVVKVGLAPIIIDLMEQKILTGLSFNGAAIVHDLELAMIGRTSEDVAESLQDGSFGFSKETAKFYHKGVKFAVENNIGLGEGVGKLIEIEKLPYRHLSLFASAARLNVPATVHIAVGTNIVHMHPEMDAGQLGQASYTDFLHLASIVSNIEGGVYMNIGSAVILPEVFLKALSMARNIGGGMGNFTAVNLDMITHYRPSENVLKRPGGKSYNIVGHHELILPLLRAAILCFQEDK